MKKLEEKTLSTEHIYQGRVIQLQIDDVQLPNGEASKREIVKHPGAVAIIAITADQKLVLVRQFRKALEKTIYEIPAGKLEQGEEPLVSAQRELQEETGYRAEKWERLIGFYTSPGFADEYIHLYLATKLVAGEVSLDEDEFVERVEWSIEECQAKIASGDICDAKTIYAIAWWNAKLNN
jgi:ADP-ribose pyrophosphatase